MVVEDDEAIAQPLRRVLLREGYAVRTVATGREAIRGCRGADLLLLDLSLPDLDGLEVCRAMRSAGCTTPVLMLTARAEDADVVVGLDAGADDYVTKPFGINQLLARVRALLRRAGAADVLRFASLEIDREQCTAVLRCAADRVQPLDLTPTEFALLLTLAEHAERLVERDALLTSVWGTTWPKAAKTVDVHIFALRRKLAAGQAALGTECPAEVPPPSPLLEPIMVATVRGRGFRLVRVAEDPQYR